MAPAFLTAQWRSLAILNYAIDPAVLAPLVPAGVELDRPVVSMVGFLFLDTRVLGVPIPFHRDFEEVNLRFYVRRLASDGWRRGVVFVKEIVPRAAITAVARAVYNENYATHPMRHLIEDDRAEYSWKASGRWNRLAVETTGDPQPIRDGSEEEFITEHYWGYAAQRGGGTVEYQVEHPRWRVSAVSESHFDCDVESICGPQFAPYLSRAPKSAFLAEGSPIVVRRGVRIE